LRRLVLDTNILISAALRNGSFPHQTLLKARSESRLLVSDETLAEFRTVLLRDKFDKFIDRTLREGLFSEYARHCTLIQIPTLIRACRDPKDDKFLEVAVHGRAELIVTGDADLLVLHPFRGIAILTPADYLNLKWSSPSRIYPESIMTSKSKPARRVAVYCGSANGNDPAFLREARALGAALAAAELGLVYGGASVGLMGAVADAALAGGAEVIGVLPDVLAGKEIAHAALTRLELVSTMHERKARMAELADAFVVLPGGYGTLEELLEVVTWAQLRMHAKPIILVNTAGYWDGLLMFLDTAVAAGFLKVKNRELLLVAGNAVEAVGMVAGGIR